MTDGQFLGLLIVISTLCGWIIISIYRAADGLAEKIIDWVDHPDDRKWEL